MRLASNPPVCETRASLDAWMRLTALNVARNTLLAEARRARREQLREHHAHISDINQDELTAILTKLDAEELELLRLRHVEGLRLRAIAHALGATPRAIESAIRRIKARFREGGAR